VFISYRREDADWVAGRLRHDLAERFKSRRVFMDVSHVPLGQRWDQVIVKALWRCRVGIVVVGDAPDLNRPNLPGPLQGLPSLQALSVTDASWTTAVEQLALALQEDLKPAGGARRTLTVPV
jgi:hypothetical protein